MSARLIDGKAIAASIRADLKQEIAALSVVGRTPGLAVVLVGDDPASAVYVGAKARQTAEVGMRSFEYRLPADTSQASLLDLIDRLNADDDVDGILVQLPLPRHIDAQAVLRAINPAKDVDGFHPTNVGLSSIGAGGIVPCTPRGAMMLIRSVTPELAGLNAVVVGRSNIVGKPMAQLLLSESCTVTVCHSRTVDLPAVVRSADILVAAVGIANLVKGDWIKPGAIVIDVGINRIDAGAGRTRLVGDVLFDEALPIASAITPVPGGVGPMTIACLLSNTLDAYRARCA